ncbi:MAG: hypothetical protein D6706_08400, partial [Chloroflexi bacterium]
GVAEGGRVAVLVGVLLSVLRLLGVGDGVLVGVGVEEGVVVGVGVGVETAVVGVAVGLLPPPPPPMITCVAVGSIPMVTVAVASSISVPLLSTSISL